jgi:peptidoglycan/xylan/chitin deacetylase (PgdA/CDA1 family)
VDRLLSPTLDFGPRISDFGLFIVRLDRFITLNLVQPLRRLFNVQSSKFKVQDSGAPSQHSSTPALQHSTLLTPIPILMYHSISDDPEHDVSPYYKVSTSPAVFRQHMQFLAAQGYRTIRLDELVSMLTIGLPDYRTAEPQDHGATMSRDPISAFSFQLSAFPKLVCITFDDGFRDFYTETFSVLQNHGFTATMFLPTAFIGDERRLFRPSTLNPQLSTTKECLTWSEIRELRKSGIDFGSHTVNHPKLVELSWPDVECELLDSKAELENQLQAAVTAFCYPYAFPQTDRQFVHRFTGLLSDTGYRSCATTELGRVRPGADPFRLKRLPANSLDDLALFAAKLDGAYDWLACPQGLAKRLKSCLGFSRPQTN